MALLASLAVISLLTVTSDANPDAKRLYSDLMTNYNRLIRPVENEHDTLTVKLGLKLSQLIDINERDQVMTTNIWLVQEWTDYKLQWNVDDYGGVTVLYIPATQIWVPDIVLFNNADGNYEVNDRTKATVHHDGRIEWLPPAIYKSSCTINVEYFPFDVQLCEMKFASWTYDGKEVEIVHMNQTEGTHQESNKVDVAIDMGFFLPSVEWDVLAVPARKNYYNDLPDITFSLTIRRKTLFYTINLIIPCIGISFLTVLVFYLPTYSGEKMALSINILVTLTFFFLVLSEIIPPTSLVVPLIGKYLLFTMILVTFSIMITVGILNVNYRSVNTHDMPPWMRRTFLYVLPKLLFMKRPDLVDTRRYRIANMKDVLAEVSHIDNKGRRSTNASGPIAVLHHMVTSMSANNPQSTTTTAHHPYNGQMGAEARLEMGNSLGVGNCVSRRYSGGPTSHRDVSPSSPHPSYMTGRGSSRAQPATSMEHSENHSEQIMKAMRGVLYIEKHIRQGEQTRVVKEDWKFAAMVIDRLFLWIFTTACVIGTCGVIMQAPTLYDRRPPINMNTFRAMLDKLKNTPSSSSMVDFDTW